MFCSNCGKTLKTDATKCPHCGAVVGESRFEGHPYTGAQVRIKPGEAVRLPVNHTKTVYMGSDPTMEGDVETRTTYRATAEGAAPQYTSEPLFNAIGEEVEYDQPALDVPEDDADYLTPEMAEKANIEYAEPEKTEADDDDDYEEDADYDEAFDDAMEDEEEDRIRAERKAEKKARRDAKRAERRQRQAELEAEEDEELGEPIEDFELDEDERRREERILSRRARREQLRRQTTEENEEELSELRPRTIEVAPRKGISEDVSRYMSELRAAYAEKEEAEEKKAAKKAAKSAAKEASKKAGNAKSAGFFSAFKKRKKEEDDFDLDDDINTELSEEDEETENLSPAEAFAAQDAEEYDEGEEVTESGEVYGDEEEVSYDDDAQAGEYDPELEAQYVSDSDDLTFTSENPNAPDDFSDVDLEFNEEDEYYDEEALARRRKVFSMLKYTVIAAIVVAIIVGVSTLLTNIARNTQKSQIPNVTTTLFEEGVELMQFRVGDDYMKARLGLYNASNSSTLIAFSEAMSNDLDSLSNLLPENPDLNDQRFINALSAIQEDINNCLTNDILALSDANKTNDEKQRESNERWATVRAKVSTLASATDKAQLDAIIKGERIEVIQQVTPEPEPTATPEPYTKLSKGSKGQAVINLQTRLTQLGYMSSEIDGDYGNKTKTAIQLFQKAAGLETTGIADVETQTRLFAPDAPMKGV